MFEQEAGIHSNGFWNSSHANSTKFQVLHFKRLKATESHFTKLDQDLDRAKLPITSNKQHLLDSEPFLLSVK